MGSPLRNSCPLLFDSDAGGMVQVRWRAGAWVGVLPRVVRSRTISGMMLLVLGAGACSVCKAQGTLPNQDMSVPLGAPSQASRNSPLRPGDEQDPMAHRVEQKMSERRNEERQKALVADTDRLLNLAQQLKTEVDKSSKDQLSIDVYKRAEQIEKLARSVKEKMRGY